MIATLVGRRCTSVRRFRHRYLGEEPSEFGPVEFGWSDGRYTTIDADSDWTMELTEARWQDPYAETSAEQREELAAEVGLWEPAPLEDDLASVIRREVSATEVDLNEVDDISALHIAFGDVIVSARLYGGNLYVSVRPG